MVGVDFTHDRREWMDIYKRAMREDDLNAISISIISAFDHFHPLRWYQHPLVSFLEEASRKLVMHGWTVKHPVSTTHGIQVCIYNHLGQMMYHSYHGCKELI